jgi:RNA polymerase sigma factor (sigma-70 family)
MSEPALTEPTDTSDTDQDAFVRFYLTATRELVAFLLIQGASLPDAADIVQDLMATAYRRWTSIGHPRAWAYRTAGRALIRRLVDADRETPVDQPPEPNPLLRTPNLTNLEAWEQHQDIITELATLPPRQRQIMAWTAFGHTPTEIAKELALKPGTVRQNLALARKALSARRSKKERNQ